MLAPVELGGTADAGRRVTPSSSRPRSSTCCEQFGVVARPAVGDRGRHRARHVHRAARRRHDRQGAGAGAAHPGDPGPEPRPGRVPAAVRARGSSSRRSTPAATSSTTRDLPAGARRACSGCPSTRSARPTISSPSSRPRGEDALLCGDGVAALRATRSRRSSAVELAGPGARRAEPRRAGRARDRRATSARSSAPPADVLPAVPAPERRRDRVGPRRAA